MNYIYGINAVAEAIKARGRSFESVSVAKERHDLRLQRVVDECRKNGIAVRFVGRGELDRMAGNQDIARPLKLPCALAMVAHACHKARLAHLTSVTSRTRGCFVQTTRSLDEKASMKVCWSYGAEYVG